MTATGPRSTTHQNISEVVTNPKNEIKTMGIYKVSDVYTDENTCIQMIMIHCLNRQSRLVLLYFDTGT